MSITVSQKSLTDLCEGEDIDLRVDYSGRGMFGRRCVGITGNMKDLMRFTLIVLPHVQVVESDDSFVEANDGDPMHAIHETWFDVHQDNMGLDMIYYWPWVQVIDDTQDEDEKQD